MRIGACNECDPFTLKDSDSAGNPSQNHLDNASKTVDAAVAGLAEAQSMCVHPQLNDKQGRVEEAAPARDAVDIR